ncbi:MAG: membrane-targeted effector domain-containing toxin, partial [Exilibacterium sp.]
MSSRSSRIAEVLNEKRTPGERAGYHTPPPFATPARAARNAQPQPTQRPSFATPPRGYRADFTVNTHKASSSGTKKASSAEASTASTSTGRHANARNPVFAASLKELAKWSEIEQTSIADPRSMRGGKKKILMTAKTTLETSIGRFGLQLSDVLVHDDGKTLAANLNHIEFKKFFKSGGLPWDRPADNVVEKCDSLIKKADSYFEAFQNENRADLSPLAMPRNNEPLDIIKEILQGDSGLVIGEVHNCVASKRVLIENMKDLKSAGVTTLFMEHLCSDSHGKDLANYFSAPKGAPMPKRLEVYLDTQTRGQRKIGDKPSQYGFKELVQAAKEAGINVIPVDTAATYATSTSD